MEESSSSQPKCAPPASPFPLAQNAEQHALAAEMARRFELELDRDVEFREYQQSEWAQAQR